MLPNQEQMDVMRLVGKNKLALLAQSDEDARKWLSSWVMELSKAHWNEEAEILKQYPLRTKKKGELFVFRIGTSNFELEVRFLFPQKIALIEALRKA